MGSDKTSIMSSRRSSSTLFVRVNRARDNTRWLISTTMLNQQSTPPPSSFVPSIPPRFAAASYKIGRLNHPSAQNNPDLTIPYLQNCFSSRRPFLLRSFELSLCFHPSIAPSPFIVSPTYEDSGGVVRDFPRHDRNSPLGPVIGLLRTRF